MHFRFDLLFYAIVLFVWVFNFILFYLHDFLTYSPSVYLKEKSVLVQTNRCLLLCLIAMFNCNMRLEIFVLYVVIQFIAGYFMFDFNLSLFFMKWVVTQHH